MYNNTVKDEVNRRKAWFDTNESWLAITDHDVENLDGFETKLEEQKVRQTYRIFR